MLAALLVGAAGSASSAGWHLGYCNRQPPAGFSPLPPAKRLGFELAAVAIVTRHGARAPTQVFACWPGFEPDAFTWACNRPAQSLEVDGLRFALNYRGTEATLGAMSGCAAGQLLDEGRDQQRLLGQALRNAYAGSNATVGMLLPDELPHFGESGLKLRSSSLERTIVSGQELIAGLVSGRSEPRGWTRPLAWEVGEPAEEWIYPNEKRCPRLAQLEAEADAAFEHNPGLAAFDDATRRAVERDVGAGELSTLRGNGALDCLMTTACQSDVDPAAKNLFDASGLSPALASESWQAIERFFAHKAAYNQAAWPRLALGPLGHEIRTFARSAVEGKLGRPRLALWSAHDTTVTPLLAALGVHDGRWAPYAANLVIEVWKRAAGSDAASVRLLFMGEDITWRLPGCERGRALCPFARLEDALAWSLPVDEWLQACARTDEAPPRLQAASAHRSGSAWSTAHASYGEVLLSALVLIGAAQSLMMGVALVRGRRSWRGAQMEQALLLGSPRRSY
ncbi:histidine phosphatase superfamily [Pavlovales sp. CCMP2436]|nr:histidine phosphatase superfamily [Pavlovales sp. CCMP2436]|mmetsp:Transcript_18823/g.47993  ORF Transcript_18823/g.47993 Transcript_18823/m.47993 type:complete len:509 (+) Transcript_18823:97-1623(+)